MLSPRALVATAIAAVSIGCTQLPRADQIQDLRVLAVRTEPDVAGRRFRIIRAVVDFPQPDSPTSASVSPLATAKEMPQTAWTTPPSRPS